MMKYNWIADIIRRPRMDGNMLVLRLRTIMWLVFVGELSRSGTHILSA